MKFILGLIEQDEYLLERLSGFAGHWRMEFPDQVSEFIALRGIPLLNSVSSTAQPRFVLRLWMAPRCKRWNCSQYLLDFGQQLFGTHFARFIFAFPRNDTGSKRLGPGVPSQDMRWLARLRFALLTMFAAILLAGATIEETVTDPSGRPLENARIDHVGKMVVVVATDLVIKPSPDEIRTDGEGHFRVTTSTAAFVVRKPGYESERIRVNGDQKPDIVLRPLSSTSRCKLSHPPEFKTKAGNDTGESRAFSARQLSISTRRARLLSNLIA